MGQAGVRTRSKHPRHKTCKAGPKCNCQENKCQGKAIKCAGRVHIKWDSPACAFGGPSDSFSSLAQLLAYVIHHHQRTDVKGHTVIAAAVHHLRLSKESAAAITRDQLYFYSYHKVSKQDLLAIKCVILLEMARPCALLEVQFPNAVHHPNTAGSTTAS